MEKKQVKKHKKDKNTQKGVLLWLGATPKLETCL